MRVCVCTRDVRRFGRVDDAGPADELSPLCGGETQSSAQEAAGDLL